LLSYEVISSGRLGVLNQRSLATAHCYFAHAERAQNNYNLNNISIRYLSVMGAIEKRRFIDVRLLRYLSTA